MMDAAGRYVAIVLSVLLIFLFPLQYIAQAQNEVMDEAASVYAAEFADTARHRGYITKEMYEELIEKLDNTGEIYDIVIETAHPVTGKEMAEINLGDEISDLHAEHTSYKGEPTISFDDEAYGDLIGNGTTTSTLASTEQVTVVEPYQLTRINVQRISVTCPKCGTTYSLDEQDMDHGCPNCKMAVVNIIATPEHTILNQGASLPIMVWAIYGNGSMDEVTEWSSDFNSNLLGIQNVTISYLGFTATITVEVKEATNSCAICGEEYKLKEDGTDPGCPVCSKEVMGIDVVEDHVTIETHSSLPITVMATFRDGHTEAVTDWSADLVPDTAGTYMITIFYQSVTTQINVTVIGENLFHCAHCGFKYYFNDSPQGCPVCSKTIIGIEAALRSGTTQVMCKSKLNPEVIIIFKDLHRAYIETGWSVEGYDPNVLGMQVVTVRYQGFSTTLTIEVVDELPRLICPKGHVYYANEEGSDPGCPYCDQVTERENAVFYFNITYTEELLKSLYKDGIYYLEEGNYLSVIIIKRDASLRSKLTGIFFKTNGGITTKRYTFGGEVL